MKHFLIQATQASLAAAALLAALPSAALCPFAVQRQGFVGALPHTDAALLLRHAISVLQGATLSDQALLRSLLREPAVLSNPTATALLASNVRSFLTTHKDGLDIDGDGQFSPTDATVITRYLLGFRGAALKAGLADTANATRVTGEAMQAFIDAGCTVDAPLAAWNGFQLALISGDAVRAKSYLTDTALDNFGDAIDALLPQMAALIESLGQSIILERGDDLVQLALSRADLSSANPALAPRTLHFITLVKSPTGLWLIDAM